MAFRYVVRCLALAAVALVGAGCSSGALPTPTPAGTSSSAGQQHAGATVHTAAGTVTVTSHGKVVCVITLKNGTGSCKVSTKGDKPGIASYTGTYNGGVGLSPTKSKPVSVQILGPKAK
jgi:hypothetical protein